MVSSVTGYSDDLSEKQLAFLDLPLELRYMVYEEYLPNTVTVGQEDNIELAILSTCRQIYEEALLVLKNRSAAHLVIRDTKSYQLARSWINQSGDFYISKIQTLDIDSWTEVTRSSKYVDFARVRFSVAFGNGFPGFSIKYTLSDDSIPLRYKYPQEDLNRHRNLPAYLREVIHRLFGKAHDRHIGTDVLKDILEAIASYSKWIHEGQTEHMAEPEVEQVDSLNNRNTPERCGWVYLYPSSVIPSSQLNTKHV
ncbi:MAG: hypothetical protein Q9209_003030 [Squamulea sp. 1 TL-2023]